MKVTQRIMLYILGDRIFLPFLGVSEVGVPYDTTELVLTRRDKAQLADAIDKARRYGNPPIKHPTQEEFRKRTPVQQAIGTSSYKKMAKMGVVACMLYWTEEKLYMAFSPRTATDVQLIDYGNAIELPESSSSEQIASAVLSQLQQRGAQ